MWPFVGSTWSVLPVQRFAKVFDPFRRAAAIRRGRFDAFLDCPRITIADVRNLGPTLFRQSLRQLRATIIRAHQRQHDGVVRTSGLSVLI